jgi:hypothetical protein
MVELRFEPAFLEAARDRRIAIPTAYCGGIPWLRASETKQLLVWFLMIVPGRFRILPDAVVEKDAKLGPVRSVIINGPADAEVEATVYQSNERAAVIGRLIPIVLTGPHTSWRLIVPKQIVPVSEQYIFVLLYSLGYVELWLADVYEAALRQQLDSVI